MNIVYSFNCSIIFSLNCVPADWLFQSLLYSQDYNSKPAVSNLYVI